MNPERLFLVPSTWAEWETWLKDDAPRLFPIVVGLLIVYVAFRYAIGKLLRTMVTRAAALRREDPVAVERRARTLIATLNWMFATLFSFLGAVLVLDNLNVNVGALIAGIGIAGVAVGLGAQALIRDIINGTFILVEGQYLVGDVVTVAGVSGEVIEVNPRRTVLRDADGSVHTIPNSAIAVATNHTSGFSRILLDVPVAYSADIETVRVILRDEYLRLAHDYPNDGLTAPSMVRVQALLENRAVVRISGDVRVGRQWELTGELRKRIADRFASEGIGTLSAAPAAPPAPQG